DPHQIVLSAVAAESSLRVVGYVWATLQDRDAFLTQAYSVHPEASRLLDRALTDWARDMGADAIKALVGRSWLRALEKRYGYRPCQVLVEKRIMRPTMRLRETNGRTAD